MTSYMLWVKNLLTVILFIISSQKYCSSFKSLLSEGFTNCLSFMPIGLENKIPLFIFYFLSVVAIIDKNVIVQLLLLIHIINGVSYFLREGHHPFILFHACLDPFSIHSIPLHNQLALDTVCEYLLGLGEKFQEKYRGL